VNSPKITPPIRHLRRIFAVLLHATIKLRDLLRGDRNIGGIGCQIVPKFRDKSELLLRGKSQNIWIPLKDHADRILV